MNRLSVALMATLTGCGPTFAQGRLPSPALVNPTITGGTLNGTDATAASVTVGGITSTLGTAIANGGGGGPGPGSGAASFTSLGVSGATTLTGPTTLSGGVTGPTTFSGVGLGGLAIDAGSALTRTGWLTANSNGGSTTWTTGSGAAGKSLVFASGGQIGAIPASGQWGAFSFGIPADSVDSGSNSGFNGMMLSHNWGGASMTGNRTSLLLQSVQTGAVGTANASYNGATISMTGNFAGNGGSMFAINPQVSLTSGATGWVSAGLMGGQVQAIQPVNGRVGVQMSPGTGFQGSDYDFAYGISGIPSGTGFLTALQLGKPASPWGLDPTNGAIISAAANNTMQLKHGIDLHNVAFTSDSWNDGHVIFAGNGTANLNAGTGLALSATAGFVQLPFTAGVPTGAPAGNDNCAVDTTNGFLNCYFAGAWHNAVFAAGASAGGGGGGGGTVTSVTGTGTVPGITLTGAVSTTGALTLGGTLSVPLDTAVTGNLAVSHLNGGLNASSTTTLFGDGLWKTPSGSGTVTSVIAGAGLTGGTITGSGTIAVAPMLRPLVWQWDDTTIVHNTIIPLIKSPWANAAPISNITYHANGTGSTGSFVVSLNTCTLYSGGTCTPVTNCASKTVSAATDTTVSCTGSLPAGQYLNLIVSGTTGTPTSSWFQAVIAAPAT